MRGVLTNEVHVFVADARGVGENRDPEEIIVDNNVRTSGEETMRQVVLSADDVISIINAKQQKSKAYQLPVEGL